MNINEAIATDIDIKIIAATTRLITSLRTIVSFASCFGWDVAIVSNGNSKICLEIIAKSAILSPMLVLCPTHIVIKAKGCYATQ